MIETNRGTPSCTPPGVGAPKTVGRLHSSIASFMTNGFEFYDLTILGMALVFISKEFHLTYVQAGLLSTATLIGCALSALVIGWISDNKGRRTALIIDVVAFSVLTAFIAVATTYNQLLLARFLGGIFLGGTFTLVGTILNETWPIHQRGRATTLVWVSSSVGVILASIAMATILPAYGWRWLFGVSIFGLLIALYIFLFVPETEVWKKMKAERKANTTVPLSKGLKELFSGKLARYTILGTLTATICNMVFWIFMFWLASFLIKERHLSPSMVGKYMLFQSLGQLLGVPISGFIADKIGRKPTLIGIFVLGAFVIPFYMSLHNLTLLFWMGPVVAAMFTYPGLMATWYPELYPAHLRSLGVGFNFNMGRGISAAGAPIAGALVAVFGSLQMAVSVAGVCYILGAVFSFFLPETFNPKTKTSTNVALDQKV